MRSLLWERVGARLENIREGGSQVSKLDELIEHLEAALHNPDERQAFVEYLQGMTPEERAELLAEAEQRDPEGALNWTRGLFDSDKSTREN